MMNILYCFDNWNQLNWWKISIKSLIEASDKSKLNFLIMVKNEQEFIDVLVDWLNLLSIDNFSIHLVNSNSSESNIFNNNAMLWWLIAPSIFKLKMGKILYLDNDTIVNTDVLDLNNYSFDNRVVFLGTNYGKWSTKVYKWSLPFMVKHKTFINNKPLKNYFNTGVVLINIENYFKFNINNLLDVYYNDFVKLINKYSFMKKKKDIHNDEMFLFAFFYNYCSNSLNKKYNQSIKRTYGENFQSVHSEVIFHLFGPFKIDFFNFLNGELSNERFNMEIRDKYIDYWLANNYYKYNLNKEGLNLSFDLIYEVLINKKI